MRQIGARMNRSESAVKILLFRATRKLKEAFGDTVSLGVTFVSSSTTQGAYVSGTAAHTKNGQPFELPISAGLAPDLQEYLASRPHDETGAPDDQ